MSEDATPFVAYHIYHDGSGEPTIIAMEGTDKAAAFEAVRVWIQHKASRSGDVKISSLSEQPS